MAVRERSVTAARGPVFYGWFDDVDQPEPSHDPPRDAPCLFCGYAIWAGDVRTHSLTYPGQYGQRSYFYRTHGSCSDRAELPTSMDGFVLDMIARNGD